MEYLVAILVYIFNRWWLALTLIALPYILLVLSTGNFTIKSKLLRAITIIGLIVTLFPGYLLAPLINYFGRIAVAEIVSAETTMVRNEDFSAVYSVKAVYQDESGEFQEVAYWDTKSRGSHPLN